ncbi:AAA family ATPase [Campylobacterota bacterium DY0563]
MMKIKEIRFKSFRAYKYEVFTIPEGKNIILLYARNGFGKTSFFDGVEWGLTGKLLRYHQSSRERNEYPVLRNSFCEPQVSDGVEIIFNNDTSVKRFIKNELNDYDSGLLNLNGQTIDSLSEYLVKTSYQNKIDFERSFNFSQLLSQDLISNFIRHTSDPDRYRTVVNLFGLDSYKNYDEHIQCVKQRIREKLSYIESEIQLKSNELELERAKLNSTNVDEKVIIEELEGIYQSKINLENIGEYKKHFSSLRTIKNNEVEQAKIELEKLQYVYNNVEKEEIIKVYNALKEEIESLRQFVSLFSKKKYFESVEKNLNGYKLYLEKKTLIDENEKKLNELHQELNTNPFFQDIEETDNLFRKLAIYKTELKDRIEKYFISKETIQINNNSVSILLTSLEGLYSLKNKLLNTAKDFFELEENKDLKNCPVCDNKFDINNTVEKIEKQLNTDLKDSDFSEITDSISQLKENNEKLKEDLLKEESELYDIVNHIKKETKDNYEKLSVKSREYDLLKEAYKTVVDNLALLKIELESFENAKTIYFDELQKHKEYKSNGSEEYYQKLYDYKNQSIDNMYTEIQLYVQYKEEISFINMQILSEQIKEKQDLINSNNVKIGTFIKALSLISSLENHFGNNEILGNISSLDSLIEELNIKNEFLSQLDLDYTNLKDSIKETIDDKTKELLGVYQETIKKFYHYLNPNVYMRNLSIKETMNNANRLVFEVSSDDNMNKHSPSYIFSSAQNNVLALSIFLSFAIKQQWSELDAIFLDDPIQNMDDINIHSFVDLVRSIEKQTDKQFFISTHDERIYQFMLNKFGEENVHTFTYEDYGVLKNNNLEPVFVEPTSTETINEPI